MMRGTIYFVAISCLQFYARAASTVKADPDAIKFPGPIKEYSHTSIRFSSIATSSSSTVDVPDECKDRTFCTIKPKNYPQDQINKLFKGMNHFNPNPELHVPLDTGIANKQGDPEDKDDCESVVTYEPLYNVRNKRGDWLTVAQAPEENYVQQVRLETCSNPGAKCFNDFVPPPEIIPFCKQTNNMWEFTVVEGNSTAKVTVELPVCCSCHYKPNSLILNRFGKT